MKSDAPLDWKCVELQQIADVVLGGTPSTAVYEYWNPAEIHWVTAKDVSNFPVAKIDETERKISESGLEKSNAKLLPALTTVIIARGATTGKVRLLGREMAINQTCYGIVSREEADPVFIYYYFNYLYEHLRKVAHGSVFDTVTMNTLNSLEICLPPLSEQRAIAHILGTPDDKIELNRRMNRTLEAMAQAVFKSWFVDFDPVRAKAAGEQPPGLTPHIADLFPDAFEESELGEIPRGWEIGTLEDLLVLQRGFDLPKRSRIPGPYQVIAASGPSTYHNEAKAQGPGVVTGRSGVLGKVFLVQDDFWPLNTTLWVKEFKVSKPHHAYFTLQQFDLAIYNAGSAVPTLNRNHIHSLRVAIPDSKVIDHFESISELIFGKMEANDRESDILAELRDSLLPKLICGELRIPDAERILERCL